MVVTEHGIADLRGVSDSERARRLAAQCNGQSLGDLFREFLVAEQSFNFTDRPPIATVHEFRRQFDENQYGLAISGP